LLPGPDGCWDSFPRSHTHHTTPSEVILTTQHILLETLAIIETILSMPQLKTEHTSKVINKETIGSLYAALSEKISSSLSQRHIGHYKAMAKDENLADLLEKMMAIPHLSGFSPRDGAGSLT
jgi:hypothetical protein